MLNPTKLPHWIVIFLLSLTVGSSSSPAQETGSKIPENAITVESTSGAAELALAQHLKQVKAKLYGAYWCSHCYEQIYLFGQQSLSIINRIECAPQGKNAQPDLCKVAKIQAFPTWEINGKFYSGVQTLEELATLSGYQGTRNFKNFKPVNIPSQYSPNLNATPIKNLRLTPGLKVELKEKSSIPKY